MNFRTVTKYIRHATHAHRKVYTVHTYYHARVMYVLLSSRYYGRIHHVRDIHKRARVEITMRDYKSRSTRRSVRARERLKCILYIAGARETRPMAFA